MCTLLICFFAEAITMNYAVWWRHPHCDARCRSPVIFRLPQLSSSDTSSSCCICEKMSSAMARASMRICDDSTWNSSKSAALMKGWSDASRRWASEWSPKWSDVLCIGKNHASVRAWIVHPRHLFCLFSITNYNSHIWHAAMIGWHLKKPSLVCFQ